MRSLEYQIKNQSLPMGQTILRTLFLLAAFASLSPIMAQATRGYGISLYPNFSHRRLVVYENTSQAQIDSLEMVEGFRPSYAAGLVMSFRGEKAGFQIGLNYSETGFRGDRSPLPITDPEANRFTEYQVDFRTRQIELPLALLFYQELTPKDEFFFLLGTGISYNLQNNFLITRFNGDISEKEEQALDEDTRPLNYNFQAAMGWERQLSRDFVMSIAPTFRLWMQGLIRDDFAPRNFNLYQLGVRLTFRFETQRN